MPMPFETARNRWNPWIEPRPPHPSWSRGDHLAPASALSAADFWNRLGL